MKNSLLFFTVALSLLVSASAATYDVTSYGANGSDSSDDTSAIQAAINAADSSGGTVYIPSGTYLVSAGGSGVALTSDGTCVIVGDVANGSIVKLTTSGDLLSFSVSSASPTLTISDLTFTTSHSSAGTALSVTYPSGSPATSGLNAERFHIRDNGGTWTTGIKLKYAKNSTIKDCLLSGHQTGVHTVAGGKAVSIENDSSGTSILTSWISFWNTGVDVTAALTSLTIDKTLMVWVGRGLFASQSVGALQFINSHVDARGTTVFSRCVDIEAGGSSNAVIRNNLFIIAGDTAGQTSDPNWPYTAYGYRYHLIVKGSNPVIDGNQFLGSASAGSAVVIAGSTNATIRDNIFHDIAYAVYMPLWIQSGVSGGLIEGNSFDGCGTNPILNQGSGFTVQYNKTI
jgi:hypothetical protein